MIHITNTLRYFLVYVFSFLSPVLLTYHSFFHVFSRLYVWSTHTLTAPARCPCGPEKDEERKTCLTRTDLIKLPVTLTNLLVLSHRVELSPPPSTNAPPCQLNLSFFPPPSLPWQKGGREVGKKKKWKGNKCNIVHWSLVLVNDTAVRVESKRKNRGFMEQRIARLLHLSSNLSVYKAMSVPPLQEACWLQMG